MQAGVEVVLAVLRGDWGKAWSSLGAIVSNVLKTVVGIVRGVGRLSSSR